MSASSCINHLQRRWLPLTFASSLYAGMAQAQDSYRIATEGTYPPWSFKDAQGTLQGWDVDIANALCERMNARCEIVAQDWDGMLSGLISRTYDLIVASMAITEQRRQRVAFSTKYDLVAGRVQYIFGNMVTCFVGFLKTPEARDFAFVGPKFKGGPLREGNGNAVGKDDAQTLSKVNAALAAIRADGTYDRITAKCFPFKLM